MKNDQRRENLQFANFDPKNNWLKFVRALLVMVLDGNLIVKQVNKSLLKYLNLRSNNIVIVEIDFKISCDLLKFLYELIICLTSRTLFSHESFDAHKILV